MPCHLHYLVLKLHRRTVVVYPHQSLTSNIFRTHSGYSGHGCSNKREYCRGCAKSSLPISPVSVLKSDRIAAIHLIISVYLPTSDYSNDVYNSYIIDRWNSPSWTESILMDLVCRTDLYVASLSLWSNSYCLLDCCAAHIPSA